MLGRAALLLHPFIPESTKVRKYNIHFREVIPFDILSSKNEVFNLKNKFEYHSNLIGGKASYEYIFNI